jgi:dihydroxyacid dehydratase/phosphogluconate dehydratase
MREMLAVTGAMKGAGRGGDCALITDGRFSGAAPTASASATSRPRPSTVVRSRSSLTATAS